jgi:Arc/MetJ family transcription regulator
VKKHAVRNYLHQTYILMHMAATRTTLNLDDELLRLAREYTGIQEKTALIHEALRELVSRAAARRLAALGGSMPHFGAGRRRKSGATR